MDAARHSISTDQILHKGEVIFSPSGQFKAVFEENGDFNLYGWNKLWSTKTDIYSGDCITLNKDSTLTIYRDGQKVWTTDIVQPASDKLRLNVTDQGHVTITDQGKEILKFP